MQAAGLKTGIITSKLLLVFIVHLKGDYLLVIISNYY
ncbi:hypothetical protein BHY_1177 (plasmid) [Borrelia nietonii YOR]|uniref:Uncharacterized protein n=2 Tax=Borrelia TaxID=138 RepID=W5SBP1_9SPIR|nr:hypothetical protein BHY_1177 [Borrelia nietonii YOR]AHH14709.1 hypothetical protein BHW_0029300 [Borrelia hermsii MTW]